MDDASDALHSRTDGTPALFCSSAYMAMVGIDDWRAVQRVPEAIEASTCDACCFVVRKRSLRRPRGRYGRGNNGENNIEIDEVPSYT